jgi:anaerobic dimethyl sulfoxide reductase subunit C (anchor subunit)
MGAIYSSSLMSGWHSINTFTSFYGTALVIGPVLAVSLMIISLKDNSELVHSLIKSAFYISIFGLAVQVIGVALFATTMPEVNMIGGMNALASLDGYQETVALRWVIEILGAGVLGFMSFSNNRKVPLAFAYVALIVLFFAEGMSRYVFYVLGA